MQKCGLQFHFHPSHAPKLCQRLFSINNNDKHRNHQTEHEESLNKILLAFSLKNTCNLWKKPGNKCPIMEGWINNISNP
jgi:hypothetical protein